MEGRGSWTIFYKRLSISSSFFSLLYPRCIYSPKHIYIYIRGKRIAMTFIHRNALSANEPSLNAENRGRKRKKKSPAAAAGRIHLPRPRLADDTLVVTDRIIINEDDDDDGSQFLLKLGKAEVNMNEAADDVPLGELVVVVGFL